MDACSGGDLVGNIACKHTKQVFSQGMVKSNVEVLVRLAQVAGLEQRPDAVVLPRYEQRHVEERGIGL